MYTEHKLPCTATFRPSGPVVCEMHRHPVRSRAFTQICTNLVLGKPPKQELQVSASTAVFVPKQQAPIEQPRRLGSDDFDVRL